jgi:CHAT domain-containing protein
LRLFADVYAGHLDIGWEYDAAVAAFSRAECYLGLNRFADALEVAEEAVERCERHGMPLEAAKARFYAALALARGGDVERALTTLESAARSFANLGLAAFVGYAALLRASLYLDDAKWSAAFQESRNAREIFAERGLVVRQAQAEIVQARASLALADLDVAVDLAHSVQRLVQEHELRWLANEGYHILAKVAEARGEIDAAQGACEAAITSIERVQGQLAAELRTNFLADKLEVYQDAIALSLRLSRADQAFAYLERAKSRALVDYLAGNPEVRLRGHDARSQGLLDELVRLREEHNWLYSRLYGFGLTTPSASEQRNQDRDALRQEVRDREKRIGRILERLTVEDAASLASVAPVSTDRPVALPVLEDDTVLLEYYFTPDSGLAFVVSHDGLTVVSLDTRPGAIRQLLDRWQLNLHRTASAVAAREPIEALGRNARGLLGMLYRALIQPVETHLAGYRRLIVIPYGPTHAVPFVALHDGRRYVIETLETSLCPSSSLLRLCADRRREGAPSALVVAHSNAGRLPAVLEEASAIAGLFPGECYLEDRATRAALVEAAPRHQLLHLAAHGEARLDNPTFAHLQLADGQLTTIDVFNLDLDGALVTLSACETGRSVVTGGDELVGLSRGFLYAGAATLVQSLWRVDDGSTALTMAAFYRALAAGQTKGAALRAAQLDLLADRAVHPFFWAPFQLIGDHGPIERVSTDPKGVMPPRAK